MSSQDPADCVHKNVLTGTTVARCTDCGLAWNLYASAAEAIAACRAVLAATKPVTEEPA